MIVGKKEKQNIQELRTEAKNITHMSIIAKDTTNGQSSTFCMYASVWPYAKNVP